jgi:hypothetical protein
MRPRQLVPGRAEGLDVIAMMGAQPISCKLGTKDVRIEVAWAKFWPAAEASSGGGIRT